MAARAAIVVAILALVPLAAACAAHADTPVTCLSVNLNT
jgi:hypothetical protein